jgi:ketosteroid isomerase-like protein
VKFARARQFVEAVAAHDLEAAEELLDPDVETVTPRGTLRGIAACRQVLQKASGDEQFAMEQAEPEFEDIEGDVIARTHEIARWRETGEVAYERDFEVRLTLDDERIVRIVVMPGARCPRRSIAVHRRTNRRNSASVPAPIMVLTSSRPAGRAATPTRIRRLKRPRRA